MFLDILLVTDAINDGSVPLRVEVSCSGTVKRRPSNKAVCSFSALFLESQEYVPVHGDIVLKYI